MERFGELKGGDLFFDKTAPFIKHERPIAETNEIEIAGMRIESRFKL